MNRKIVIFIQILLFVTVVLVLMNLGAFKWIKAISDWRNEQVTTSDLIEMVK